LSCEGGVQGLLEPLFEVPQFALLLLRVHLFAGAHTRLLFQAQSFSLTIHGVVLWVYRSNIQWCELDMKLNTYI